MRSDRIATCTSGEPVSSSFVRYSPISVCLRSAVIDIGWVPSTIDDAHRAEAAILDPRQTDKQPIEPGADDRAVLDASKTLLLASVLRRHALTVTQAGRLACRQGQGRDVVQHGLDRQQMPGSGQTMPKRYRRIQRNRLAFGEAADRQPAQFGDVAEGAERGREIACQGADIGA